MTVPVRASIVSCAPVSMPLGIASRNAEDGDDANATRITVSPPNHSARAAPTPRAGYGSSGRSGAQAEPLM